MKASRGTPGADGRGGAEKGTVAAVGSSILSEIH